ncbi:MAG TPA: IPT/TIG domain-containing protein [Terriglobales bacterium]
MRRQMLGPDRVLADAKRYLTAEKSASARNWVSLGWRVVFYILAAALAFLVLLQLAHAENPRYVAGPGYFNQGLAGTPLTWAGGSVTYYTDQGNLSPIMPGPSADALVANAFSQWSSISTVALTITHAGQLAEDVNGTNVYRNSNGTLTEPADIEPSATGTPVGVVYDYDGTVTNALLGQGAGNPAECFWNASYGGVDNFGVTANYLHALVVINGECYLQSSQQTDVEYRLVRVLGGVLGLGWSQANLNVITGNPPPTPEDYAGFPVMHNIDPFSCVPITVCYPNPYQPAMDDEASLSQLYPAASFSANTAEIYGSVYFANAGGQAAQPMQGVNVVARWIDPSTGQASRQYVATSVSGFLFTGNAGNEATGFDQINGEPFNQWGSGDTAQEGYFDLPGLQLPNGHSSGQYQLTVEAVDPLWSTYVGPYDGLQVEPSGSFQPIVVNVALGTNTQQNIVMQDSAVQTPNIYAPTTYQSPAAVPEGADWKASLSPYGDLDYFWFSGQANRSLAVLVTALDSTGNPTESKAQPVIGMWALSDPGQSPAPANTPSAFNSQFFGVTQLNAQLLSTNGFRIGISDYRGDGRPDYLYHARILYGDHLTPSRIGVTGGSALAIAGLGLEESTQVQVGSSNVPLLGASAQQLLITAPPAPNEQDGVQNVTLIDPPTQATAVMTGALIYGAAPTDLLTLLSGSNPSTPVGGQAPNPMVVEVTQSDGVTPVAGASVVFTSSPAVGFGACSGATTCTVYSDESGIASTAMTVLSAGVMTITAQLAPAAYSVPQQVQTTLFGTESSLDISLLNPYVWIAQGANANITLTARVLSEGQPVAGRGVNFYLDKGSATLNPASATTNSNGYASSTAQIASMSGDVQVSVCAEPGDKPCQTFYGTAVSGSLLELQPVSGIDQMTASVSGFQPIVARVTDTLSDPVQGATVLFQAIVGRTADDAPIISGGDNNPGHDPLAIILGSWQQSAVSGEGGLVSVPPSSAGVTGEVGVLGTASAGSATLPFVLQSVGPP